MSFDTLKEVGKIIPNGHTGVQPTALSLTGTVNLNCIQNYKRQVWWPLDGWQGSYH
jgi:hypothetical protein